MSISFTFLLSIIWNIYYFLFHLENHFFNFLFTWLTLKFTAYLLVYPLSTFLTIAVSFCTLFALCLHRLESRWLQQLPPSHAAHSHCPLACPLLPLFHPLSLHMPIFLFLHFYWQFVIYALINIFKSFSFCSLVLAESEERENRKRQSKRKKR